MTRRLIATLALSTALLTGAVPALAVPAATKTKAPADALKGIAIDIPSSSFRLRNGLTVVVHEDHSSPLVAVNIWYHVGSKNEPKGRSGFAHLFEHLMFNGSENFNDDFFKATQKLGATKQNGTTSDDRTNYFQTVPTSSLDAMLWLESDRMGHLLGAIDQAKLDEQRKVVQNEKRQGDNRPYAKAQDLIIAATAPVGHPYDHSTIGSMDDLNAATLADVKDWFRTYYGPSNAVLVLAGDITPAEARQKVEKYFGDIDPGTPVTQPKSWIVKGTGTIRETAYDRVAQPRLYRVWNISDYASADTDYLQILAELLGGGKNSRLYRRLVVEEQLASQVASEVDNREIGGQFYVTADVKPGADIDRVEQIIDQELKRLIATGPTPAELARVRTATLASYARSLESISQRAAILAESETYLGDANGWKASLDRLRTATPGDIARVGTQWLGSGDYALRILPFGDLAATGPGSDRKAVPAPGPTADATFPSVERATLANGLNLVVAHKSGAPVVNFTLLVPTGAPADFQQVPAGTGSLAVSLMDEGTLSRTKEQISEQLAGLGATLQTGGGGEQSAVSLSTLKPTIAASLELFADVVRNPAFANSEIARVKSQFETSLAAARQDPGQMAGRVLAAKLYGPQNPNGTLTTAATLQAIDRAQIQEFYRRWFKPNNATLIVTGDTNLAEVRPQVERALGSWQRGPVPERLVPTSAPAPASVLYLVDKPGAPQSVVYAAVMAPARLDGDELARDAFNTAFGGSFTSRLNMKLREEKGWAYGAGSRIGGGRGSRLFRAGGSVQADKTADTVAEIARMVKSVVTDQPLSEQELATARDNMRLGLTGDWSTGQGIGQYLADEIGSGLPTDYYSDYSRKVTTITLANTNGAATSMLAHSPLTWVVVGDRSKIEAPIRQLGLAQVVVVDADGNPVK